MVLPQSYGPHPHLTHPHPTPPPPTEDLQFIFFPDTPNLDQVAQQAAPLLAAHKARIFGGMYHVTDGAFFRDGVLDFNQADFEAQLQRRLRRDARLGLEYINFQVHLPPQHQDTGGEYRQDLPYLQRTAERLSLLHRLCHAEGLNCYIETHVERVSEDVPAFAELLRLATEPLEVTCDFSHYLSRGITRGTAYEAVVDRCNHLQVRLARRFGDLSAHVADLHSDWAAGGPSFQVFQASQRALRGGLSSRVIGGETGPLHLVQDTLEQDARLIPLLRLLARTADAQAQLADPANPFPKLK